MYQFFSKRIVRTPKPTDVLVQPHHFRIPRRHGPAVKRLFDIHVKIALSLPAKGLEINHFYGLEHFKGIGYGTFANPEVADQILESTPWGLAEQQVNVDTGRNGTDSQLFHGLGVPLYVFPELFQNIYVLTLIFSKIGYFSGS